ncbi:MAG: EAL domain-containing protein [Lachnospiraceae bacterium]|nr:EAL domain-containing protein [Lachnospiraceae bacterium]
MDSSGKIRILIIEDSYIDRLLLSEAFKGRYSIITANNGVEGLNVLGSNDEIGLVLLDLAMPKMDGFEVLSAMKSNPKTCNIPVIVVTSSDDTDNQIRALDLGAYDVLFKPLNTRLVIHRVQNIFTQLAVNSINEPEKLYQHVIAQSEIDEKTGIYNRHKFIKETDKLLNENPDKKYYIFMWDVDGFKVLNDACGTAEGDRLLACMGKACKAIAVPGIVYGRWEADHFVACIDDETYRNYGIIEKIVDKFDFDNPYFNTQLRLGIYSVDDHYLDVRIMCDRALMALKSTKGSYTRHHAFFDESMRAQLVEERQIVNECASALEKGQFVVYLQPQYDYSKGYLHGAEALIRWLHPKKGLIPPNKFIPIFEKNGFITRLDEYVWEQVCKLQHNWIEQGLKIVPISVNVSRVDISSNHLCEFLEELINKYEIPKSSIRLEITESAYMDNPKLLIESVKKIQSMGFSVEMDDFGSGYSSLNTLKDVPVDMLKLDMKFLEDGNNEDRGGSILSSVVRMSNWLKLPVIAEGVETKSQADYLKSIGCVFMQGYYFARPMPISEYEVILKNNIESEENEPMFNDDISGAYEFLNASTQATLVFNSFVGGAAIVEYNGELLEAIRVNDRFYSALGVMNTYFTSRKVNLLDAFDEKNRETLIKAIDRAISDKSESNCEVCSKDFFKKNEDLWLKIRIRLLAVTADKYLMYMAVDNITQKMNLISENIQLSEQLLVIMNNIPSGIIDYEIRDGRAGIIFFNDNVPAMFGYSRDEYEELFTKSPEKTVHPDDRQLYEETVMRGITNGDSGFSIKFRHLCKDGCYKTVSFGGNITRKNDKAVFISGIINEIKE